MHYPVEIPLRDIGADRVYLITDLKESETGTKRKEKDVLPILRSRKKEKILLRLS